MFCQPVQNKILILSTPSLHPPIFLKSDERKSFAPCQRYDALSFADSKDNGTAHVRIKQINFSDQKLAEASEVVEKDG